MLSEARLGCEFLPGGGERCWRQTNGDVTVSKFWQRLLVVGVVFAIGVSGLLVRPLAAADDFAAENKLFRDWVVASDIIRENYVESPEYELLTRASISAMLRTSGSALELLRSQKF
jgi:hypothetical protein